MTEELEAPVASVPGPRMGGNVAPARKRIPIRSMDTRCNRLMAVIHISRAEAASDFDGLLTLAANGDEVFIESDKRVVARLLPADAPRPRLLSESLKILKERGSAVTLDGEFGRDLEDANQ